MGQLPPVLGQLLGLHLETSTCAAILAALAASVSVVVNLISVSRTLASSRANLELTLEHAERQARAEIYRQARDEALRVFPIASLALEDLEQACEHGDRPFDAAFAALREARRELVQALLSFGAHSEPNDPAVELFGQAVDAYRSALDAEHLWHREAITRDEVSGRVAKARASFDAAAKAASGVSMIRGWATRTSSAPG